MCIASTDDCEFRIATPRGMLKIEVKNAGRVELFLDDVRITFQAADMVGPLRSREWREYVHSLNFASLSGVKKVGLPSRWLESNPASSMVYALNHIETGKTFVFSCLPPHAGDYVTFQALHAEAHQEGDFGLLIRSDQQRAIPPGRKAAVSPLQCVTGDEPLSMLESVGDQWAKARRRPLRDVAVGWNSWDYFAGAVTSKHIYRNQRKAKPLFGDRLRYFVIDEGWEPRWGAWVANWKFPEGTKGFCRKIKSQGGVPGVWTAPFVVNTYTDLYRDHPEWFARDDEGQVVQQMVSYGPMAMLDITHPAVEGWVEDLFRRLRSDGFEYFKVDFAAMVLQATRFHDMTIGRGGILRKAFETIRRGIGEDAYLLACGAPYESVFGIVDAVRATGDIHNFWGHVVKNAASLSARWWMHRKLWNIDPDFLIVRSEDTSPDRQFNREHKPRPVDGKDWWLAGREMVLDEVRTYALLVYLSGGDVVLGDDLPRLNRKGIEILRKVIETPNTAPGRPVDLFGGHDTIPAIWSKEEADFHFVGAFNWSENAEQIKIGLSRLGVKQHAGIRTFWSDEIVQAEDEIVTLSLRPRSSEGLMIRK